MWTVLVHTQNFPACNQFVEIATSTVFVRSDAVATIYFIAQLCGFYSRVATNRERHLLNSVLSVKSSVIGKGFEKIRLMKNCEAVTWF